MKRVLITTALSFACATFALAQDPAVKAPAGAGEKEKSFANAVLEQALNNMSHLKGYHIKAEITTPAGKAGLEGDLGVGAMSLKGQDPRGNTKLRIAADENFYLSTDNGATWKSGAAAETESTILFSRMITGPIDLGLKIWEKSEFTAKEEKIDGEDVLHLEKPAAGKEPAVQFWIVREPDLQNAVFVRKVSMTISASDGDFPVVVTYTKLNNPAEIKVPVVK